jgi:hypothetical protein
MGRNTGGSVNGSLRRRVRESASEICSRIVHEGTTHPRQVQPRTCKRRGNNVRSCLRAGGARMGHPRRVLHWDVYKHKSGLEGSFRRATRRGRRLLSIPSRTINPPFRRFYRPTKPREYAGPPSNEPSYVAGVSGVRGLYTYTITRRRRRYDRQSVVLGRRQRLCCGLLQRDWVRSFKTRSATLDFDLWALFRRSTVPNRPQVAEGWQ